MLYYIHGYKSSCKSGKAVLAKELLKAECIEYSEADIVDGDALFEKLENIEENDVVIGSSMGGYLALYSKARTKILLNPLMEPKLLLQLGPYNKFIKRALPVDQLLNKKPSPTLYTFLAKNDEVLAHNFKMFKEISKELYILDDNHNFTHRRKLLFTILKEITDEVRVNRSRN